MNHTDLSALKSESDRQLALRLEKAVEAVKNDVISNARDIQASAQRITYLTSCFFENYQDICKRIKEEDKRFIRGVIQIIKDREIIYKMLQLYFELVFKNKKEEQLLKIRDGLLRSGVRLSTEKVTIKTLTLSLVACIIHGIKMNSIAQSYTMTAVGVTIFLVKIYGLIPKAKQSAERLQILNPAYYQALYTRDLEMMFFIIEPLFMNSRSLFTDKMTDEDIIRTITYMAR